MGARTLGQRIVAFFVLLGVTVLTAGLIASAEGEQHRVELITEKDFDWRVTGYIEYTHNNPWGNSATIRTSSGSITVEPGDRVKIVVNTVNQGKIWFGADGWMRLDNLRWRLDNLRWRLDNLRWMRLDNLPVEAIYINGELVASNTVIKRTHMCYDLQSLVSTLKIEATLKQGKAYSWARLTVDGQTLVNQWDYNGYFVVYNIAPSQSENLNLHIKRRYFSGIAEGIEWVDKNGDVGVIGIDELPFLHPLLD